MSIPAKDNQTGARKRRTLALKWHLMLLVVGVLLPIVAFALYATYRISADERSANERQLVSTARGLNDTLDREFTGTIRALQGLAASDRIDADDLGGFYDEARRVLATQPTWLTVILVSPDARQLFNTIRPFGSEPVPINEKESFQKILDVRQPVIGNIVRGDGDTLAFPVRVPVERAGQLRYVLTAVITAGTLNDLVHQQSGSQSEWTRTVVDARGTVAARTRDPERFVGGPATESFVRRTSAAQEGVYRDRSLENKEVYFAFTRSLSNGWVTAVVVTVETICSALRPGASIISTGTTTAETQPLESERVNAK